LYEHLINKQVRSKHLKCDMYSPTNEVPGFPHRKSISMMAKLISSDLS